MNYLLLFKNYKNMFAINYLVNFVKSIGVIIISYNIPILIFNSIINLSNMDNANIVSKYIYIGFYKIPAYLVLYAFIGNKINKQLTLLTKKITINPAHIYVPILINMSYFLLTLLGNTYKIGWYIIPLVDILTYSLYFSEFTYPYIDNRLYNYHNFIDFFNNNIMYFLLLASIYTALDYYVIPDSLYLLGLFVYTVLISPLLLSINYNKYDSKCIKYYNIFYPFERVLSCLISITSLVLLDKLTKRNIQIT